MEILRKCNLIEDDELISYIENYKISKEKNYFIKALNEIKNTKFLMPMKVGVKSTKELDELLHGNYQSMKENDWMKKDALHCDALVNGKRCELLCLFTSYERAKEYFGEFNGVEVTAFENAYNEYANVDDEHFGGVIINPKSDNFIITNGYARMAVGL